jgi:hypothetical protein
MQGIFKPFYQILRLFALNGPGEQTLNECNGLERLAQIMAGGRQKT